MKTSLISQLGTALAVLGVVTVGSAEAATLKYKVTDIGTLPGDNLSQAYAINSFGQVVGYSENTTTTATRPFIWDSTNGIQQIGTSTLGYANGINDLGKAAGVDFTNNGGTAFLSDPVNGITYLENDPNIGFNQGIDVNNSDQVIGFADYPEGTRAFIWDQTNGMQSLGTLPGDIFSRAININNVGQVSGFSGTFATTTGFRWSEGTGFEPLNPLAGGDFSRGFGLNDLGEVSGISGSPIGDQAVFWDSSNNVTALGILPGDQTSRALSLNSLGQVVGQSCASALTPGQKLCPDGVNSRAFLWEEGSLQALNDLLVSPDQDWNLLSAWAINSSGMIVGRGVIDGQTRAFLATPTSVPESSTTLGLIMLAGLGGLGWSKRQLKSHQKTI